VSFYHPVYIYEYQERRCIHPIVHPIQNTKGLEGSRGIALLILELGARRGWVIRTTPLPLYSRERPGTHCNCIHTAKKFIFFIFSLAIHLGNITACRPKMFQHVIKNVSLNIHDINFFFPNATVIMSNGFSLAFTNSQNVFRTQICKTTLNILA
jgi:hypothetical protein